MKQVVKIALFVVFLFLGACEKNSNDVSVVQVPFVGYWVTSNDPVHIVIKSKEGKLELPVLGEVNDARAAAIIERLIKEEISFDDLDLVVRQGDKPDQNALMEFIYSNEKSTIKAQYEQLLIVDLKANNLVDDTVDVDKVYVQVYQENADNLRLYVDKAEILILLSSNLSASVPLQTKDGFDINGILDQIDEIEFGLNLVKYE